MRGDKSSNGWEARKPNALFPQPHNALFDSEAPGGEWIDARARQARAALDRTRERSVVMHSDFSAANVRVANGIAYTARCERGLGKTSGSMVDVLRIAPDAYFSE